MTSKIDKVDVFQIDNEDIAKGPFMLTFPTEKILDAQISKNGSEFKKVSLGSVSVTGNTASLDYDFEAKQKYLVKLSYLGFYPTITLNNNCGVESFN